MHPRRQLAIAALTQLCLSFPVGDADAQQRSGLAPGKSLRPGHALVAGSARLTMQGRRAQPFVESII